jgi:hypothetical protein
MGKRKTVEQERQRAGELQKKARDLACKADVDELKTLLGEHGQYASRCLKFMHRLVETNGKATDEALMVEDAARVSEAGAATGQPKQRAKVMLALEDAKSERASEGHGGVAQSPSKDRSIDERYQSLQDLPVRDLKEILVSLEQISLSPFAIRAMAVRGAKTASQNQMAEVIEFCCGVALNATLDRCYFESLHKLTCILKAFNEKRGRRAKDLVLPPAARLVSSWCVFAS